uniref:Uncharacterized protein n=1 Tax=Megaselia scalaris TaxID=36166 RepID=T1GPQ2_MEGSC
MIPNIPISEMLPRCIKSDFRIYADQVNHHIPNPMNPNTITCLLNIAYCKVMKDLIPELDTELGHPQLPIQDRSSVIVAGTISDKLQTMTGFPQGDAPSCSSFNILFQMIMISANRFLVRFP